MHPLVHFVPIPLLVLATLMAIPVLAHFGVLKPDWEEITIANWFGRSGALVVLIAVVYEFWLIKCLGPAITKLHQDVEKSDKKINEINNSINSLSSNITKREELISFNIHETTSAMESFRDKHKSKILSLFSNPKSRQFKMLKTDNLELSLHRIGLKIDQQHNKLLNSMLKEYALEIEYLTDDKLRIQKQLTDIERIRSETKSFVEQLETAQNNAEKENYKILIAAALGTFIWGYGDIIHLAVFN